MVETEPREKKFKLLLVASIAYYVSQFVFPLYLSHFSSEWTEIWHDDSLDGRPSLEPKKFKLWLVASITYYVSHPVFPIYLSHFSSEWTEIWHDDSLDDIDRA